MNYPKQIMELVRAATACPSVRFFTSTSTANFSAICPGMMQSTPIGERLLMSVMGVDWSGLSETEENS